MVEQVRSLKTGIKYKDTPIGKIPVDWEVSKLNNLGNLKGGTGFPDKYQGHKGLKYLFVKVSDMNIAGNEINIKAAVNTIDDKISRILKCNIFPKNTIVFAKVGAALLLNRRRILLKESAIDNNMMGFIVGKGNNTKFYYYVLQSIDFAKHFFSGALPSLNQNVLGNINVVSPPFPEQKKIAEILTTVDEAIEKTARIIEKTKEAKKGLMQRLLTRGIGHQKFKKTEIGEIPEEWEVKRLGDLCVGKPEYGANVSAIDRNDLLPRYIRITDVTEDGKLSAATWQSIRQDVAGPYLLNKGDFLFARSGATVGKTYLYKETDGLCAFAGYMIRFRPNPTLLLPEFLFHYTHSNFYYNWVKGILRAGAQPNINGQEYAKMPILKPPIEEQKTIINILNSLDEDIEKETSHKEQLESLKKGLMQVLLTGKVRVNV